MERVCVYWTEVDTHIHGHIDTPSTNLSLKIRLQLLGSRDEEESPKALVLALVVSRRCGLPVVVRGVQLLAVHSP